MQNNSQKRNTLLSKTVDIEPTGVIYTVEGSTVENYVEQYLLDKNVEGIQKVKVVARNVGRNNPVVAIYLFMSQKSKDIVSNIKDVPPILRNKVDKVNVNVSSQLKNILVPLCGNEITSGKAEKGEYFVKLDIFHVLGLMFAVEPHRHELTIPEVVIIPNNNKDCVMSVIKTEVFSNKGGRSRDNYSRQIDNLEKRR